MLSDSLATPWTVAGQASLSMGFPSKKYWSGLLFPFWGHFPNLGIQSMYLALQVDSLLLNHQGSPGNVVSKSVKPFQSLSSVWLFATPWHSMPGFPVHQIPRACANSCLLSQWYNSSISSSVTPSFPVFNLSQNQGLFQWVSSLHQVA